MFSVAYVVRAVSPGRYVLPQAYVEDMYRPDRFGRTETGTIEIIGKVMRFRSNNSGGAHPPLEGEGEVRRVGKGAQRRAHVFLLGAATWARRLRGFAARLRSLRRSSEQLFSQRQSVGLFG